MSFRGVNVNKLNGGLGLAGEASDRICVLVIRVTTPPVGVVTNKPIELLQIEDLERLGFTPATETKMGPIHYNVSEYFRLAPENKLWVVFSSAPLFQDCIVDANFINAIRNIAGCNTIAFLNFGYDDDALFGVNEAQAFVDLLAKEYLYIDTVIVEGENSSVPIKATDFENLRDLKAPNVSVCIAGDIRHNYGQRPIIGAVLGSLAVRQIHENLGSVDIEQKPRTKRGTPNYSISDAQQDRWLNPSLTNGKSINDYSLADLEEITKRGYIYVASFNGYSGVFFNDSPTCVDLASDYSFIELNAIWNKVARTIRNTLLPRVRSKVETDVSTGYIKNTTITYWDGLVRAELEKLIAAGNIAGFDIYIDPNQAAVSTKPFRIKVQLVVNGIVREFDVDLGYTKSI